MSRPNAWLMAGIERSDLSVDMKKPGFCQERGSLGRDMTCTLFDQLVNMEWKVLMEVDVGEI